MLLMLIFKWVLFCLLSELESKPTLQAVKHPKLNLEKFIKNCFSFYSIVNILSIFSSIFPIIQSARGSKLMIYVLSFTLIENFLNDGVCQCALMRA